jgi:hypothetical protein
MQQGCGIIAAPRNRGKEDEMAKTKAMRKGDLRRAVARLRLALEVSEQEGGMKRNRLRALVTLARDIEKLLDESRV